MLEMWTALAETWLSLAPWLVFGALLTALLARYVSVDFVERHLRGRAGVFKATLIGIPLPLCSCGVIPAAAGLRERGAGRGATLAFLTSTPQTGVDSIAVTYGLLGWPFALLRVVAALVAGLLGGLTLEGSNLSESDAPPPRSEAARRGEESASSSGGLWGALRGLEASARGVLEELWGWILFGVVAAVLIEGWLPPAALGSLSEAGLFAAMSAALALSLPLYLCATASVPIAAALVAKGLPLGAALVFLMAGPATNLATMGAVRAILGGRALFVYLGTLICCSFIFGVGAQLVLELSPPQSLSHSAHGESGLSGRALWELAGGLIALLWCGHWLIGELVRRLRRSGLQRQSARRFQISGLTCEGCARGLEEKLQRAPGISGARVDKSVDEALIVSALSAEQLEVLIDEAGYQGTLLGGSLER